MTKRVVVLGGGVGGLVTAHRLSSVKGAEIVLVDKQKDHLFQSSLLWVMTGERRPEQIRRDLSGLTRRGVELVFGEVTSIDPEKRQVTVNAVDGDHDGGASGPNGGTEANMSYDYLVVSLGADLAPDAVPGLGDVGFNLYDLDGVKQLAAVLEDFQGGRVVVMVSSIPFKCPAAPYEAAFLIDYILRRRGLDNELSVEIVTPEPQPMPAAGPAAGAALTGMLEARGIAFHPGTEVREVDAARHELVSADGGRRPFDLLVAVPPHRPAKVIAESPLAGAGGWVAVDPKSLATKYENVFAIGDVTSISLPGRYKPDKPLNLPKAGVFAHYQADTVAHNIAAELTGRGEKREFSGRGWCMIETGHGRAGIGSGDFYGEPAPRVRVRKPSVLWHWGKLALEKYWLRRWF